MNVFLIIGIILGVVIILFVLLVYRLLKDISPTALEMFKITFFPKK